jgi:hypothetical protein
LPEKVRYLERRWLAGPLPYQRSEKFYKNTIFRKVEKEATK